jgi:hypothetical protein
MNWYLHFGANHSKRSKSYLAQMEGKLIDKVAVKERPIGFSAPMVRAERDDRKTKTRRTRGLEKINASPDDYRFAQITEGADGKLRALFIEKKAGSGIWTASPYGKPGDRLWVRETVVIAPPRWTDTPSNPRGPNRQEVGYVADDVTGGMMEAARDYKLKKTPAIHMPRWASRILLEITDIRVERLGEIDDRGAMQEGVSSVTEFIDLWKSINGSWRPETWVWVLQFKRV